MIIPPGFGHVQHLFGGVALPRGAAVTYGLALNGGSWDPGDTALLHEFFTARIMPVLANAVQLQRTVLKLGPNNVGPSFEYADPEDGGYMADSGTPNTTYLVRKVTAMGGRENRGRFYLPGVAEAQVNDAGVVGAARLALLQTGVNGLLTDIRSLGMEMVILHNASSDPTTVTDLVADPRIATQRRRLR